MSLEKFLGLARGFLQTPSRMSAEIFFCTKYHSRNSKSIFNTIYARMYPFMGSKKLWESLMEIPDENVDGNFRKPDMLRNSRSA